MMFLLSVTLLYFLPSIIGHKKRDLRGRRPAARLCNCWSGPLLHAVRSDDAWRSFLPNLRSPVVARMIRASGGVR
jgi:hypothetical protein